MAAALRENVLLPGSIIWAHLSFQRLDELCEDVQLLDCLGLIFVTMA